jgi:hypothetical protein
MDLEIIGPPPLERNGSAGPWTGIGTVFPEYAAMYTRPPLVHMWQRHGFIDELNSRRLREAKPSLSPEEEQKICGGSVDLIFEPGLILIRPDPERMDLAFAADELLQTLVSKRQVKFLKVADARVREAIKRRGEIWRLSTIPCHQKAKEELVRKSRVAIHGQPIYFYNRLTGTRWLTYHAFEELGQLADAELALHLQEIADHTLRLNRLNRPEVDFFAADLRRFGAREFAGVVYARLPANALRAKYEELKEHFRTAVHEAYRKDDLKDSGWCGRMISTLFLEGNENQAEHVLSGLSPEFFLRIEWLPGGRFEEGEFLIDSILEEARAHPEDLKLQEICDLRARDIIFNYVREYVDLEYINVGRIPESLSLNRPRQSGRRGVYIAEFKPMGEPPIRRFIRLQKYDIWHHLDKGKQLLEAIERSEEYTDYWLDRRLGCRQLGMNLTHRVIMRRLSEKYTGANNRYNNQPIHTTYFEREYLTGIATDKLEGEKLARPNYAAKLAVLLGEAAASSLIVGRSLEQGNLPVFDDGDEVIRENGDGLPMEILVGDHSGAFGEFRGAIDMFATHYAKPVNVRARYLTDPRAFAETYLAAFRAEFINIQEDYRKRRRAFDTMFKHCTYDENGSFAFRWECVLRRLDKADVDAVIRKIREQIMVLNGSPTAPSDAARLGEK